MDDSESRKPNPRPPLGAPTTNHNADVHTAATTFTTGDEPSNYAWPDAKNANADVHAPALRVGPATIGHELPFVQPSSYLRPSSRSHAIPPVAAPMSPIDEEQMQGLRGMREFLRVRTSYDVLPLSFRLIILDNELLIKKSLNILIQNGIVSAPLWDSHRSKFAGLLTATDYINLIQYYCQFPEHIDNVDKFRLSSLRDIERAIGVLPLETVSVHPSKPLYEACSRMLKTRARRIPLVDIDDETGRETVVSVITQYRILKFIAVNTEQYTSLLKKTVREIGLGTYTDLKTGTMTQSVLDVINLMVTNNISAVPIVDKNNVVLNVFEAVDVIPIIKTGVAEELDTSVGEALSKRGDDFGGIFTCQEDDRLDSIFITLRQSRLHRLVVIDDHWHLKGMISLSDILKYVLFHGEDEYFPPV
ncbi:CBS-domain-containing protein [Poronia punctata]|nr:CBS-domain-containing protein [Poronia punctata]